MQVYEPLHAAHAQSQPYTFMLESESYKEK